MRGVLGLGLIALGRVDVDDMGDDLRNDMHRRKHLGHISNGVDTVRSVASLQ